MLNRRWLWSFVFGFTFLLSGCSTSRHTFRRASADWAKLELEGAYVLVNNVWNKGAAASKAYDQSIFEQRDSAHPDFGWRWQWPDAATVVAYPEVIYGDKPWDPPAGRVPAFPFHPGSKRLVIDYDISIQATGRYNMAFELWPVSQVPATKEFIQSEIMIWIDNRGMTPAGEKIGSLRAGGGFFDVYVKKGHSDESGANTNVWDYVAFTAQRPVLSGPLDTTPFLDYLVEKGLLSRDQFITSVELGNEIITGTGVTRIRKYRVRIE